MFFFLRFLTFLHFGLLWPQLFCKELYQIFSKWPPIIAFITTINMRYVSLMESKVKPNLSSRQGWYCWIVLLLQKANYCYKILTIVLPERFCTEILQQFQIELNSKKFVFSELLDQIFFSLVYFCYQDYTVGNYRLL